MVEWRAVSDGLPHIAKPVTAELVAAHVREALESNDVGRFAELLSPDVHWGAPGDATPPCQNRKQVLKWYSKGREAGRRVSTVTEVEVHGDAVLVGMHLEEEGERWQVLRVGPLGVNDIRGFEDRVQAAAQLLL
jgi:SnoaL-like domain